MMVSERPVNGLDVLVELLNTVDLRTFGDSRGLLERDILQDSDEAVRWLVQRRLLPPDASVTREDLNRLRALREQLRTHLIDGRGIRLQGGEVELVLEEGQPHLQPTRAIDGVVPGVVAVLISVSLSPAWSRLRVCAAPDCRWGFHDRSRSGRARWCSMKTCGNRMKTRSYRERVASRPPVASRDVAAAPRRSAVRANVFRREGEYWSVSYARQTFRLKDSKGLRYMARLIAEPGRELHVLDLVGEAAPRDGAREQRMALAASSSHDIPLVDPVARRAYASRLEVLRDDLAEAENWGDAIRAARAREEIEFLAGELKHAVGLGGRARTFASDSERARISVTRVVKAALARIGDESPELRHHFASTLHTGMYCSYRPDPRLPIRWQL